MNLWLNALQKAPTPKASTSFCSSLTPLLPPLLSSLLTRSPQRFFQFLFEFLHPEQNTPSPVETTPPSGFLPAGYPKAAHPKRILSNRIAFLAAAGMRLSTRCVRLSSTLCFALGLLCLALRFPRDLHASDPILLAENTPPQAQPTSPTPLSSAKPSPASPEARFFETEVRPLLAEHCFECHSEKKQKGRLRLDSRQFMETGGESGPALLPDNPEKSLLLEAIRYQNSDLQMPPEHPLSQREVATLEKWVRLGAPWPQNAGDRSPTRPTSDPFGFTEKDRQYWAFQPVGHPQPPPPTSQWAQTPIDRFIEQKLAENGLQPAPEADRKELLRRLTFTLHGLPPTAEQTARFLSDPDPKAYETLVDTLLASPRFGERWAQHWLDLTRYAESDGYNQDAYRPSAWPYRDYVIRSLNADKPYDQFVREQIAGDEIAPGNVEAMAATGYLRNGIYEYNQRDARGQYEVILTDMTDNAGEVFLGLSMGCARCHDHKFDPILQKDYYRLRAFFTPLRWRDDLFLATEKQKAEFAAQQAVWEKATADLRTQLDEMLEPLIQKNIQRAYERFQEDIRAMVDRKPEERSPEDWQYSYFCERQMAYERERFEPLKSLKSPEQKERYQKLTEALKAFDSLKPEPLLRALVATDATRQAPPNRLKTRQKQTDIGPGFLTLLDPHDLQIPPLPHSTGRRSALAAWITRSDNPLSTRVITNRVWHSLFGTGLVATPNDFGRLGKAPSHPQLLDYLTRQFLEGGWSLKKLHREILLSATFRQTARRVPSPTELRVDPGNQWLWRFPPRRLDAEQIRDALLMASGELDLTEGGPSAEGTSLRRSIYTMKKRNSQTELLRSLDAPAGFASTSERLSTTTPTQALLLVNGDWILGRAQKLASRVNSVDEAWQHTLGRPPSPEEHTQAESFLHRHWPKSEGLSSPPLQSAASPTPEPPAGNAPVDHSKLPSALFKENTPRERILAQSSKSTQPTTPPKKEGDEFTLEAIVELESIDSNAAVRTLASRWNNGKDNVESFGWSVGVTGEKSRFKPRNLIIQLVGEDENGNIAYEPVASGLRIELGVPTWISVSVSCSQHNVQFRMRPLHSPDARLQEATASHTIRAGLSRGVSDLILGGTHRRAVPHHWDGSIEALQLLPSIQRPPSPPARIGIPLKKDTDSIVFWDAKSPDPTLTPLGPEPASKGMDPRRQALVDLCHVLLNTNEFFYLH